MLCLLGYLVIIIYCAAITGITLFCLMQLHLWYHYMRNRRSKNAGALPLKEYPFVTVQLPVYNERYVVERLIDAVCSFDYPRDRLEIQILDDSTDETTELSMNCAALWNSRGVDIRVLRRDDRDGYKAGALQYGLHKSKGEYIAIFDADFLPAPDFLKRALPLFTHERIAAVQTRWEHLNDDYSLITRLQAFQLNVHFSVEQSGRLAGHYMLQFNGTAGIWRREAIEDAGGWQADTLTEDLDLSYRAQLRDWSIMYAEDISAPAELPVEMHGLKSQQFRWMKGGAQTAKKLLPVIWRSSLTFRKKLHASAHLLSGSVFVLVFLLAIFSVPMVVVAAQWETGIRYFTVFLAGLLAIGIVYYTANARLAWPDDPPVRKALKFVFRFPVFLALSMGLSLHNTIAVLQGFSGRRSAFVRTPKYAIRSSADSVGLKTYVTRRISGTTLAEGLMALYFAGAVIWSVAYRETAFILFHILLTAGFGAICYYSLRDSIKS